MKETGSEKIDVKVSAIFRRSFSFPGMDASDVELVNEKIKIISAQIWLVTHPIHPGNKLHSPPKHPMSFLALLDY